MHDMTKTTEISINFLDAVICLRTNNRAFADYLKNYFSPLLYQGAPSENQMVINVMWEHERWEAILADLRLTATQVGGSAYLAPHKVAMVLKEERKILFTWEYTNEKQVVCDAIIRQWPLNYKWREYTERRNREERLYQIMLKTIYYPMFYYFQRMREMTMLHASAVIYKQKGVVFCGLEGIGKTSYVLSLMERPETFFISDNLLFADRKQIYPCYELIRLHREQAALVNDQYIRFNQSRCMKNFYMPPENCLKNSVWPDLLIFVQFGDTHAVMPLPLEEAVARALHMSKLSGELQGYQARYYLYNLLPRHKTSSEKDILHALFEKTKCICVQMNRHYTFEQNMKFMMQQIDCT